MLIKHLFQGHKTGRCFFCRRDKILGKILDHIPLPDLENKKELFRKAIHRYERPSALLADLHIKQQQQHRGHGHRHGHGQSILRNQNISFLYYLFFSFLLFKDAVEAQKSMYNKVLSDMLQLHNYYRTRHSASSLTISQRLNHIAQKYAEYLAATGKFEHSGNRLGNETLGENLYMQWISHGRVPVSARDAAKCWYDEIDLYNFKHPKYSEETGHFTQLVWKSSQKMGVGVALSANGKEVYIVTNYYPAGNIINSGYFERNVLPAKH